MRPVVFACVSALFALASLSMAQQPAANNRASREPSAAWIEPHFPFFSSVLDLRGLDPALPRNNLVPRGLILNLGHDLWACFDVDLLRIACLWRAEAGKPPLTLNALAPGSYVSAGQKTKDGQEHLPKIIGAPWLINGIHPGWQPLASEDADPSFADPRRPAPSKEEVGLGALPPDVGRFLGISRHREGVTLHLEAGSRAIDLTFHSEQNAGNLAVAINATIAPGKSPLAWSPGISLQPDLLSSGACAPADAADLDFRPAAKGRPAVCLVRPSRKPIRIAFSWRMAKAGDFPVNLLATETAISPPSPLWPETVSTHADVRREATTSLVTDAIPLPDANPWKRHIRLADIAFLDDRGNAAAVTFDGDVWLVSGLKGDLETITWKRFTSGLHEPMNLAVRDHEIFVFDRNGIWKLIDTDNDGEAERHELFCNLFAQTAETREFPNSMKLGPDGSFYLAKGGQQGSTLGKDNGTVLRVAPDGKSYAVLGWGLRQPFIGVHPLTGLVTASDQQGHYVPSTPIHIISDHQYYGFLSDLLPPEKYPAPIADPATWIPHPVNASGASQVWLTGAAMGPFNDNCVHIGYNRPELFQVLISKRFAKTQAAVVPLTRDLELPPLNGAVNPADGQLYITGFQVWGTTAKNISGLARLRHTGKSSVVLQECTPMDKGILLRFNTALDPSSATLPASYSMERWNYQRTAKYGSPHLKPDGQTGQQWMPASSAYLSEDRRSVFIGIPDMKPVMQMRVGWDLKSADGLGVQNNAYFTPHELAVFDPRAEGFADIKVNLAPAPAVATVTVQEKPSADSGRRLAEMFGCMACHSIDGNDAGKVGPSWKGLYGSKRPLKDGKTMITADDAYLYESITNPSAKVVKGFEKFDAGMPIYAGILNETQLQSLLLYIKSL